MATVNTTVPKSTDDSRVIGKVSEEKLRRKRRLRRVRSFLIELTLFVCLTGLLVAGIKTLKDSTIWDLEAWRGCVLVYVLLAGGILAKWAMDVMVFSVRRFEARLLISRSAAQILSGLSSSLRGFIWVVMVLVSWFVIEPHLVKEGTGGKETVKKAVNYVTTTVSCVLAVVIIYGMVNKLFKEWAILHFIIEIMKRELQEEGE